MRARAKFSRSALKFTIAFAVAVTTALAPSRRAPYAGSMLPDYYSLSRPDPSKWPTDAITIANLGHATALIDFMGVKIVTDPSLFDRVGFSVDSIFTIGPKRFVPPVLTAAELQSIDLILITHAHMDHLDIPSLKRMPKTATVVACEKCGPMIRALGFSDVRELKWTESTTVKGIEIRAMGARHWGKRWPPFGTDYGFNSYVLASRGHSILLACDSAETDLFAALKSNPPDIAIFSIGAYDPWIWNHANPEQVWSMFLSTGARWLVPIHWGTFKLSNEPMEQPLERLIAAAGAESDRIVIRQIGGTWTMPAAAEVPARAAAR